MHMKKLQLPEQVYQLEPTSQLESLMTIIRDKTTQRSDFIFYSDRIIRLLVEEGLNHLPTIKESVKTPLDMEFNGLKFVGQICGISIMRAGEAMEQGLRDCCRSVRIGKILIQRSEDTCQPKLFYAKLPKDVSSRYCLLLDPMLATGGSAIRAIEVLLDHGVAQEKILFLNLICCLEGINNILKHFPKIKIITSCVDSGLNDEKFVVPGLGDFGCRYFGTDDD